jgi:hypothetical protein
MYQSCLTKLELGDAVKFGITDGLTQASSIVRSTDSFHPGDSSTLGNSASTRRLIAYTPLCMSHSTSLLELP